MRQTAELLVAGAVVALVGYGVGSCGKTDALDEARRKAVIAENGYRVSLANLANKRQKVDTVTRVVVRQGTRIDSVVKVIDNVIIDKTADVDNLRNTLVLLRTEVVTYRVMVDSLIASHLAYRQSAEASLAAADSTIAALKDAVRAGECRVLGVPCPSRWASFGGGFVAALTLALLL